MKVLEQRYVPLPVAKKIVEELGDIVQENPLLARTYEYLSRFSKCDANAAERAVKRLIDEVGLSEIVAVNIVNVLPQSIHEIRPILELERRVLSTEEVEKILNVLREECGGLGGEEE